MKNLKKVLFPTDFSRCADQALIHALHLAKQHEGELHLLHAVVLNGYDPYGPQGDIRDVSDELPAALEKAAAVRLDSALADLEVEDLVVHRVERRGVSVAPVILEYTEEADIDLIVMGTHGRRGLGHLFLGSVAEEVVRRARCPVLTIREYKEPPTIEAIERILVPVDYSDHSRRALAYAKAMARDYVARLQLLHVVEQTIHPAFYAIGKTSIFQLAPDITERAQQEMRRMLKDGAGPAVEADFHVVEGRAATDIVRFAEKNASDLVVIATHGLTGIEHLLLGSVTQKVVRRAPCPVLTVKAFGKSLI